MRSISYLLFYFVCVCISKNSTKINHAKIFNGHDAGQTQFPWQVLIKIKELFNSTKNFQNLSLFLRDYYM